MNYVAWQCYLASKIVGKIKINFTKFIFKSSLKLVELISSHKDPCDLGFGQGSVYKIKCVD